MRQSHCSCHSLPHNCHTFFLQSKNCSLWGQSDSIACFACDQFGFHPWHPIVSPSTARSDCCSEPGVNPDVAPKQTKKLVYVPFKKLFKMVTSTYFNKKKKRKKRAWNQRQSCSKYCKQTRKQEHCVWARKCPLRVTREECLLWSSEIGSTVGKLSWWSRIWRWQIKTEILNKTKKKIILWGVWTLNRGEEQWPPKGMCRLQSWNWTQVLKRKNKRNYFTTTLSLPQLRNLSGEPWGSAGLEGGSQSWVKCQNPMHDPELSLIL